MAQKILNFIFSLVVTCLFVFFTNYKLSEITLLKNTLRNSSAAMLPPIGKFFNPFNGFWQNAEIKHINNEQEKNLQLAGLKEEVTVIWDKRMVPHIKANNLHDISMAQGYITAQMRLWEMEFSTHAAAGRLSEILGKRTLEYDLQQRRLGMGFAAENAVAEIEKNPITNEAVKAYADGVNAYIQSLNTATLPIEYKLLNYKPEPWTPLKTALLGKSMSATLAGYEEDIEMTNARTVLGDTLFNVLFPETIKEVDPVIPVGTTWNFEPINAPSPKTNNTIHSIKDTIKSKIFAKPDPQAGSNNWAVNSKKTKNGTPILCNDPHLGLNLPSIWFEIQLTTPDANVYGVSLPGAPGVVIGFNNDIAWGVTNGGEDVRDWYKMICKDNSCKSYEFDGQTKTSNLRIENIKILKDSTVIDSVYYTHLGPIVYKEPDNHPKFNMAFRWKAHDPSNEFLTFYYLNRAKNYTEYQKALLYYNCPIQNFVFASATDTIAIWHNGQMPLKEEHQGRFVSDGSKSENTWQGFIPHQQNPHTINPTRNFVSSANQHPTDITYPYYYNGNYEYYRNRRLNKRLTEMNLITVEDMMGLQNDNYNLMAAETVPALIQYINESQLNESQKQLFETFKSWDYFNNKDSEAPSIYEALTNVLQLLIYDELNIEGTPMPKPNKFATAKLLVNEPNNIIFDNKNTTDKVENAKYLANKAFIMVSDSLEHWKIKNNQTAVPWANYKGTTASHLARIDAFSIKNIQIGGNYGILNACSKSFGPSWRMIVELGKTPKAYGIYPGGQSGNPGSEHYSDFIEKWAKGEYFELKYITDYTEKLEDVNCVKLLPN